MVGGINVPTSGSNTFQAFQAKAQSLGASQPQDTHAGSLIGLGASATGTPAPVGSGSSSGTGAANQLVYSASTLLLSAGTLIALII